VALLRAQRFITEHMAQLTGAVDLTVVLQRLATVIANLSTHAFDQDSNYRSAKGETEKQRQLRLKLRNEQMSPIAAVARHYFRTVPEFKELQMPPRSAKGGAFIASASAMIHAASTYKTELLARGLPSDFLEQFQATFKTFEGSLMDREQNLNQRKGATKGLGLEVKEGRNVLKVLDASVRRALSEDGALLGTWDAARAIHQRPTPPATTPSTTTTSTPAATTTAVNTPVTTTPAATA
jgi:hypothetical protein